MSAAPPRLTEIRVKTAESTLEVAFDNGAKFSLPAEYLRIASPSAEVQGHSPDQRVTVGGKRHVGIASVESIGNYAIQINSDDGHDTGLFTWAYLHELGSERDVRWADYLAALDEKGLSRDP
ncbi:MAG TPA: DUF971 domain-containing protein [Alphaproteobacteria bacterium]|nr:DUF971 domain-containing protein [Alphaproteobacteria bacterium]